MPNLSDEDAQKLLTEIQHRVGTAPKACPECGKAGWTMHSEVHFLPHIYLRSEGNEIDVNNGQAFVALTCQSCGYAKFFNVATLGFRP